MKQSFPFIDKILIFTLFLFTASSMFSISISQVSAGLGGFFWLLKTHLTDTWKEQRWPLGIPFTLFVLACLIAVVNAYDVNYSYKSLKKLLEFLIFFWVLNCVRENNLRNSLSLTLIASATVASLFGFYQVWQASLSQPQILIRVEGTLSTYMTFAGLLMMVEILALAHVIFGQPVQKLIWISIGIILYCLLLTLTRQAWLGLTVGILFLIFYWRKKIFLFVPFIFMAIFLLSPDKVKKRVLETTTPCLTYQECQANKSTNWELAMRTNLWQFGWKVFKDYPVTGCGFRCVDLIHNQYVDPYPHEHGSVRHLRGMHNNFIQIAIDTGILGLVTWLGIWASFFRFLYRKASNLKRDSSERWIVFGSTATVIAFLTGGFFETNFYDSEVAMLLYFIMALPFSGTQNTTEATVKI
jgi:O-antigen ligase